MTQRKDERTAEERKTHTWLVTATDRFMSGWGECANGGVSKCAWACRGKDVETVLRWVESRDEMKYVNVTNRPWYPRNAAHVHVYVVHEGHTALGN
jgi:hypothetical protein